jgi:hypothetical protein
MKRFSLREVPPLPFSALHITRYEMAEDPEGKYMLHFDFTSEQNSALARLEKAVFADAVWRLFPREKALEYFKEAIFGAGA